jgi:hypothetical protein
MATQPREPCCTAPRLRLAQRLLVWLAMTAAAHAQSASPAASESARIDRLERMLQSVVDENRRLSGELDGLQGRRTSRAGVAPAAGHPLESPGVVHATPAGPELLPSGPGIEDWSGLPVARQVAFESPAGNYRVGYDGGFVIESKDLDDAPFSLKVNSQNMFRYSAFSRDETSWIDSAGNVNPIFNSSNFQIPRGRVIFSGHVFDPDLSYLLSIDYNTVSSNPIGFRAYELSYQFDRALQLHVGQGKVPGSREWLESGFAALEGPDRTMATTFFRPSLSQGVWITGQPLDGVYYHAMMSNGFNTLNVNVNRLDSRFCWSGSAWWEPWGDFGRGYVDLESHETPVLRVGASLTTTHGQGTQTDGGAVENSLTRLSDGTLVSQTGAFAPGVTLRSYDLGLAAIDAAVKYRGLSLSTELYAQDLSSLEADGPLPIRSTQAYGGFLQGGFFVIPQTVELYARGSFVTGEYGSGTESAGGLNWFLLPGKSNLRVTFDAAWLDSSPANQNRTGYVAGQTGLLIRTQITATY